MLAPGMSGLTYTCMYSVLYWVKSGGEPHCWSGISPFWLLMAALCQHNTISATRDGCELHHDGVLDAYIDTRLLVNYEYRIRDEN